MGEIATDIFKGNSISKTETSKTGFPCVIYRDVNLNEDFFIDKFSHFIDPKLIKNPRFCFKNDILITNVGRLTNRNIIGKSCSYLGEEVCVPGANIFVLKHNQNPIYMAYVLSIKDVQIQTWSLTQLYGSISATISLDNIKKIKIPLPPIEIQEEIANKIDKFRKLCIEILPKELELAQKRYEYYKELLIEGV